MCVSVPFIISSRCFPPISTPKPDFHHQKYIGALLKSRSPVHSHRSPFKEVRAHTMRVAGPRSLAALLAAAATGGWFGFGATFVLADSDDDDSNEDAPPPKPKKSAPPAPPPPPPKPKTTTTTTTRAPPAPAPAPAAKPTRNKRDEIHPDTGLHKDFHFDVPSTETTTTTKDWHEHVDDKHRELVCKNG